MGTGENWASPESGDIGLCDKNGFGRQKGSWTMILTGEGGEENENVFLTMIHCSPDLLVAVNVHYYYHFKHFYEIF